MLGISVPVYPLKWLWLNFSFPPKNNVIPNMSVNNYTKNCLCKIRRSATYCSNGRFGYQHVDIRKERIDTLKETVRTTFPNLTRVDTAQEWRGLRPSTPKGPPIICFKSLKVRAQTVYISHQKFCIKRQIKTFDLSNMMNSACII